MAITRVKSTTINVTDPDKAIDFYTNKLGFELRSDQPFGEGMRWIEVAPPGAQTVIILATGFGMDDD
jgi:lactoylglutathione lyase